MYAMDAVREAADRAGMAYTSIGEALGVTRQAMSNITSRRQQPAADRLASMLNVCGYELCAVPRGEVTEQMFVIDGKQ